MKGREVSIEENSEMVVIIIILTAQYFDKYAFIEDNRENQDKHINALSAALVSR